MKRWLVVLAVIAAAVSLVGSALATGVQKAPLQPKTVKVLKPVTGPMVASIPMTVRAKAVTPDGDDAPATIWMFEGTSDGHNLTSGAAALACKTIPTPGATVEFSALGGKNYVFIARSPNKPSGGSWHGDVQRIYGLTASKASTGLKFTMKQPMPSEYSGSEFPCNIDICE